MRYLNHEAVCQALPWNRLIVALRETFAAGCEAPLRTVHRLAVPDEPDASVLMMPAWQAGDTLAVKVVTVMPGNGARGMQAVHAVVLAFDARDGALRAVLDGDAVTERRTAAASALAADFLARRDAAHLLLVGAGRIAANLAAAHASVRDYRRITVWARRQEAAETFAANLHAAADVRVAASLEAAVREADVISCATLATEPLVQGDWLKPGAHVDLVGAYRPHMRESDDEAVRRADVIYVDTFTGALAEGGDIVQPLNSGVLTRNQIAGELADLCRGASPGRPNDNAITLFKSVGTALEDYAAVKLALQE
jgi:alanine dehydrogenase